MRYGNCSKCNSNLEPVWFEEEETKVESGRMIKTGKVRHACSHLVCPNCLLSICVDDSFDGPWHEKRIQRRN